MKCQICSAQMKKPLKHIKQRMSVKKKNEKEAKQS